MVHKFYLSCWVLLLFFLENINKEVWATFTKRIKLPALPQANVLVAHGDLITKAFNGRKEQNVQ